MTPADHAQRLAPAPTTFGSTGRSGWRYLAAMSGADESGLAEFERALDRIAGEVESTLHDATFAERPELVDAMRHILDAGGKRIRPALVMLGGMAVHGRLDGALHPVAAAAELVHTATLLHDDVLDEGDVRRNRPAVRVLWGNCISVLAGDFLLVRALRLLGPVGQVLVGDMLLVLEQMIVAEAEQLEARRQLRFSTDSAMRIIRGKTASLFAFCGAASARVAGDAERGEALARYGRHLGIAFQIVDDLKDLLDDDAAKATKTVLGDLRSGTVTLPVALATAGAPRLADRLRAAAEGEEKDPAGLAQEIRATGALKEALALASRERDQACVELHRLGDAPARRLLTAIAEDLVGSVATAIGRSL